MFKVGDRVKYVIDGKYDGMTINNIYIIIDVDIDVDSGKEYLSVFDDSKRHMKKLFSFRFELGIRDERKQKLEKLCLNQEIE